MQMRALVSARSTLSRLALVLAASGCVGAVPAQTAHPSDLQPWRTHYAESLAQPDGWLSLVALQWLADGDTSVGAAAGNKLQLKNLPAHAFTVQQHGQHASLASSPIDPCLKVDGAPAHAQELATDRSPHPTVLTCNSVQMTVISRGDRLYLRVKDSASATRTHFAGLHWFPANDAARVTAKWVPYATPHTVRITNVLGQTSEEKTAGYAEFTFDGHTARLEPLIEDGLFFIFRDETRHSETDGAGRFLTTPLPDHGLDHPGTVVLDFNRAHNPPCAYTPYATCPLPPLANRLPFRISAGEKRFQD